jgi:hypothetical protein
MEITTEQKEMIEKFQCPGCCCGYDVSCGSFELRNEYSHFCCTKHVPATSMLGVRSGLFYLGCPTGFNRVGARYIRSNDAPGEESATRLRLWIVPEVKSLKWDIYNVPVWAMVQDGYLFVRTYLPRINYAYVDIIKGGTLELCPKAIDVTDEIKEMD